MYFVPVRKLFKVLFTRRASSKTERAPLSLHECLETVPEPRQRFCRRWLLLFLIPFCVFILYYHENTRRIIVVHLNTSKYTEKFFNLNKGHVVKKNKLTFNDVNTQIEDLLANTQIKEENISVTEKYAVHEKTEDSNKSTESILASTNRSESNEPKQYSLFNKYLPACSPRKLEIPTNSPPALQVSRVWAREHGNESKFRDVRDGGYFCPVTCRPRHKVAILVPYRNREQNLAVFVFHMHPFLMRQQLEYRIFIIEQAGNEEFNRGKLFNIGFKEMWKYNYWHCVVLHDVDLLPLSDDILYTCPTFPRHMCGTVAEKAHLSYEEYHTLFGGVSAMSVKHFEQINGFSNMYWGWGGEDNDMYWRILSARIPMVRYNKTVAKFTSLPHPKQPVNYNRYRLLRTATRRYKMDGLSDLEYKVIWTKFRHLYTHILADVNPLKENITEMFH